MGLQQAFDQFVPQIEKELESIVRAPVPGQAMYYGMMRYHLGWLDEAMQPAETSSGKRLRPMLCLLSCQALSWAWSVLQSKKYCTPLGSVAVVAVIEIELGPVAAGADENVIGLGTGGVVSGASVVAEAGSEAAVWLWLALLSRALTVYVYSVAGDRPASS